MQLPDVLQPVLQLLQWAVAGAGVIFMVYMRSIFVSKAELAAEVVKRESVERDLRDLKSKSELISHALNQGPTANDVHELRLGIEKLTGQLAVSNERMSGMEDLQEVIKLQVQRMDEWMRQNK